MHVLVALDRRERAGGDLVGELPQRTEPRWIDGPTAPLLDGAAATISCVPWREYDGGDHIIFIGEIVDAQSSGKDPLLFYRSTFHDLGATSSTTVWNGSQDDPHSGWFDATTSFTPIHLQPAPQTI